MLTLTDMFCGAGGSSTGAIQIPDVQVVINALRRQRDDAEVEVERLRGALKRIKPNARYISECGEPAGDEIMEEIEAVLRGDQ